MKVRGGRRGKNAEKGSTRGHAGGGQIVESTDVVIWGHIRQVILGSVRGLAGGPRGKAHHQGAYIEHSAFCEKARCSAGAGPSLVELAGSSLG